jgi:hypothetical protein
MRIYFPLLLLFSFAKTFGQLSFVTHKYTIPNSAWVNNVASGDFNGDGKPDVIASGTYPGDATSAFFYIFMSNTADSLDAVPVQIPYRHPYVNNEVRGLCVADMNHDNLDDIVIATNDSVYIYYQDPNHTFTLRHGGLYGLQFISVIRVADIDKDGNNDIVVGVSGPLSILYGTTVTDSFTLITYPQANTRTLDLIVGNVGRDTSLSIISTPDFSGDTQAVMLTKIGLNRELDNITKLQTAESVNSGQVGLGDRLGDGNNEIVVTQFQDTLLGWSHPDTQIFPDSLIPLTFNQTSQNIIIADLNCDGKDEVILGSPGTFNILNCTSNLPLVSGLIPNSMNYDDMAVAPVFGNSNDILIANTYAGVIVLQNTTAATDTFGFTTDTVGVDTTHIFTSYIALVLTDTLYTHADTLILQNNTVRINYGNLDSTSVIVHSSRAHRRCYGDTVTYADTSFSLLSQSLFQDTTLISAVTDTIILTGVEYIGAPNVNVYPNPFTTGINIEGLGVNALVEISDLTGSVLVSQRCTGPCFITRNNLPQGLYLVKITQNNSVVCRKITAF